MKTTQAGKGRAKKVQKPSTTTLVLNGVCGGGKRGRGPALHKGAFLEGQSEGRFYPDQPFVRRAANAGREPSQDIGADAANVAILQDRVHVRAIGANHNLKWVLDR